MRTVLLLPAALLLFGCSGSGKDEVLVSAAASLSDAFAEIEADFEASHPDVDIVLNLAGSSTLREQILAGAPADVFASANQSTMQAVVDAGLAAATPVEFARNRLVIAVPLGNPAGIEGLGDLADDSLLVGLCSAAVPCGEFAREALARAGVDAAIDTNEPDVRSLLTKIEVGELDAGIVYVTDVMARAGAVTGVEIPDAVNVTAGYPIAVVVGGENADGARAFVEYVVGPSGRSILAANGFTAP